MKKVILQRFDLSVKFARGDRWLQMLLLTILICSGWHRSSLAQSTVQSASSLREAGIQYRQAGQLPEAIEALRQAVALEPNHLDGRVVLGWTLHLAGDDQSAAAILQETVARDLAYVPALNALGIVYLVNADLAGAILTHSWATWLAPGNEIAYYNLSLAFERSAQYDWAISNAKKAATLEPDNPHPFVALAIAHWGKAEQDMAIQGYQQAIEVDGRYADSTFLDYLNEAGFSSSQITTAKLVLASLGQ